MSRRESSGGGQSSLGYLFGSDDKQDNNTTNAPPPVVYAPPYGIDTDENITTQENPNNHRSEPNNKNASNDYRRPQGQNSGNIITGRPSTKVKSVPGGDSSLGYLFGDHHNKQ
ncbi:hypothetical protein M9H77_32622 [Catharanthus roseus]|uniref:Uncharacterized protein n=1 Tax=Catharanthus roseus TaxID=4058 RepID=A0ACC0A3F5_CATRO|nr:hypothetical protein M9H77_32622 [Catharanthus roseus]